MKALSRINRDEIPVEVMRRDIHAICGAFEIEPAGGSGTVHGLATKRTLGPFEAAFVSLDALSAERGPTCIRRDPGEHYFMLVQDHGQCVVHQNGTATLLKPGDMFVVDATRPSKFVYDGQPAHQISIHLPRAEMLGRFGTTCERGCAIDRDDPLWVALRAVLVKMLHSPPENRLPLGEAFYGILGACFHGRARQAEDVSAQLLPRALKLIAQDYRDPDFGPAQLAARLGVSLRTLQRHFAPLSETPGQRLLKTRLAQAHDELAALGPGQSVAAVIYDCGFNDLSHFYRAFRSRYGVAPGKITPGRGASVQ